MVKLSDLVKQDCYLFDIEENVVLSLIGHHCVEVFPNNTVPAWRVLVIKHLFNSV
jgi:hypothetical protein